MTAGSLLFKKGKKIYSRSSCW